MSLGIFDGSAALGKPPSPYWADDRVKQAQTMLNEEMKRWSCAVTLKVDGLIGPMTCGAMAFVRAASKSTGQPLSAPLASLLSTNADDFAAACGSTGTKTLSCAIPAPAPPPPTGPTASDVMVMQSLINDEVLKQHGFAAIPENGKLDALTCGTASGVYADAKAGRVKVSAELMRLLSLPGIPTACSAVKPWQTPAKLPTPAPAPAPAPAPSPAPAPAPGYEQCWIEDGGKSQAVTELQMLINARLQERGYHKIEVTGVYDADTCGAVTALKDHYEKWTTKSCPAGPVVPLRCAKSTPPIPLVPVAPPLAPPPAPAPPQPKKPVLSASTIGLAAVVAVGAGWYAKKKGLLG